MIKCILCVVFIGFALNSFSQNEGPKTYEIKLSSDQINEINNIKLMLSRDICPGCPLDSCKYCPQFSIDSKDLKTSQYVKFKDESDFSEYRLVITRKDSSEYVVPDSLLEYRRNQIKVNLKKIDFNEIHK